MAIDSTRLNLFSQAAAMQAVRPTKAVGGRPSEEASGGSASGNNPFGGSNSQYVGLASNNANLSGVSSNIYGRQNISNTIGIA